MKAVNYGVILDMDGVVADTAPIILKAFNLAFNKHNLQFDESHMKGMMGMTFENYVKYLENKHDISIDMKNLHVEILNMQIETLQKNIRPAKGLDSFINELQNYGVPIGMGTSSPRKRAELLLNTLKIKDAFNVIVTSEDITRHKPHPDVFLHAARKLGLPAEQCVVFEDAPIGVKAAKAGNMKCVALKTKYVETQELSEADLIINDFTEINHAAVKQLAGV